MSNQPSGSSNGQNMGHCIALWYSRKHELPGFGQPELKLHVNLWRLDRKLNGVDMTALDLGFQVSNATSVASVHLFVPFSVDKDSITDLGEKLTDADMAIAIFNEDAQVIGSPKNQSSFSIRLGNMELSCWKLEPKSELAFEKVTNSPSQATVITFDSKVFAVDSDEVKRYVRLRISLPSEADGAFFKRYDPADRRFLSGFDEIEVVDFRFNEARNLPSRRLRANRVGDFHLKRNPYHLPAPLTRSDRGCQTITCFQHPRVDPTCFKHLPTHMARNPVL